VTSRRLELLRSRLAPLRDSLLTHPVYGRIEGIDALRLFMEHHAFAVWDFMSLLKALQRRLSCVDVPWIPPLDPAACRLVNEIVLGEESDEDGQGGYSNHFDLYRRAMRQCGADLGPIDGFVDAIRGGMDLCSALEVVGVPEAVRRFVERTFEVIGGGDVCAIASAFTFGREDLLPDVFRRIVAGSAATPGGGWDVFRYYLDRHIEVDGGEHGPMAWRLMDRLCGNDPDRWQAAEEAAIRSLEARMALWDGVCERLDERNVTTNVASPQELGSEVRFGDTRA
jgi:Protein of unknown function (DUF3050)